MQHRGQPSTHDVRLGVNLFDRLARGLPVRIPQYDKAKHGGQGDRVQEDLWDEVNLEGQQSIQVVIFEGWCVGFRPLDQDRVQRKWEDAVKQREGNTESYSGRLGWNRLKDVLFINKALEAYDEITK